MIPLTRPDGTSLLVNPDRIELVEETPDTVITLADGKKLLVLETAATVAERFIGYKRAIFAGARWGGRRRTDPGAEADPTRYEHPNRANLRAPKVSPAAEPNPWEVEVRR
ncbi:MAG TPA: flagellar FlbD family protein [Candidatus Binatia bacterium]|nr:flagellar FlbD family protein [Candidatus Binatia bacterium]